MTSPPAAPQRLYAFESPFLHAPETARGMFLVTFCAACAPLLAGTVVFGWRALMTVLLAVASCTLIERAYFRVTRLPALLGRSHAYLTGLLLGLTLPPFVDWYVPVVASAFAVVIGKAVFGGVGHFLWQPALVGRIAVAVMMPAAMNLGPDRNDWPLLAQDRIIVGDVAAAGEVDGYRQWRRTAAPRGADAILLTPPSQMLAQLAGWPGEPPWMLQSFLRASQADYSAFAVAADHPAAKPALLTKLPPLNEVICGAQSGGIGETCGAVLLVAGLYLIYRSYVKWQLPMAFLLGAAAVAAVAPISLAGEGASHRVVWWPLLAEGPDVGSVYLAYHLFSGSMLLAAFFLATEMTSRPVTTGGQTIFGLAAGALAMLLRLYANLPNSLDAYAAVLAMNTFTPVIDGVWRPRVLGRRRLLWRFQKD
jgi:electron transport complex protein RnfD